MYGHCFEDCTFNMYFIGQVVMVKVHPKYELKGLLFDVAILRLTKAVTCKPIPLPRPRKVYCNGTDVVALGWGLYANGNMINTINNKLISAIASTVCILL